MEDDIVQTDFSGSLGVKEIKEMGLQENILGRCCCVVRKSRVGLRAGRGLKERKFTCSLTKDIFQHGLPLMHHSLFKILYILEQF